MTRAGNARRREPCRRSSGCACWACSSSCRCSRCMRRSYAGGDNLTLVGIALGAYGLTQAILQIPFGMASDRWGRKPVIYRRAGGVRRRQLPRRALRSDIWTRDRRARAAGRGRDLRGGDGARRRPDARAAPHQGDGDDRLDDRPHASRCRWSAAPVLYRVDRHGRACSRSPACWRSPRSGWSPPWCPTCRTRRADAAAGAGRRRAGRGARTRAAAPQLRHLRAARGADGDVRGRAADAGGRRPARSPSTGSSTCRWCWPPSR